MMAIAALTDSIFPARTEMYATSLSMSASTARARCSVCSAAVEAARAISRDSPSNLSSSVVVKECEEPRVYDIVVAASAYKLVCQSGWTRTASGLSIASNALKVTCTFA